MIRSQIPLKPNAKHGESVHGHATPEYNAWGSMRKRCLNPKHKDFHRYGGRGIKVCEEWADFRVFLRDMGRRPTKDHSVDRINNDGNYEPSNCKWSTSKEQNGNRRDTILVCWDDNVMTFTDAARHFAICRRTALSRVRKYKWSISLALTTPARALRRKKGSSI